MENNILINKNGNCIKENYIKKHDISLYNKIIEFNLIRGNITWVCKTYNYINNITEIPKCPICKNNLNFLTFKIGYRKYCSIKCATNSPEFKINKEKTLLKIYGVKNLSQSEIIKKKKEITLQKNYGVTHPLKSNIIKERVIQTNIKNWGVSNVSQSNIISEKKKNTTLKNYNVEYNFQSEKIKNKIINTIQNKYDVDHYVQSDKNKLHIKNNMDLKRKKFWSNQLKINVSDIIINGDILIIKNLCKIHNIFEINRYNLYNRVIIGQFENICTLCNPINESSSIKENEIRNFIENELNIKTEKIKIKNKEIDIYLPDHKLGIEFNGLYWHSDNQKDNNYHLNKTINCEKQGIQLLHIFEDEWLFKKEIVKSIIKSKLGIVNTKIYARKCEIKEINSLLCNNFLKNNHMQGKINSKIRIGLFNNNGLVSVMTFSKKRLAMGNKKHNNEEYEMLRFCNKLNTQVIGGASKLLIHFIKTYHPKSILSFADRRYSQGKLYKKLGFKFICNTKPNYWYFKTSEMIRYHRFGFRKDVLTKKGFDAQKTEKQIMAERGYLRIYDCGNMKFEIII